MNNSDNTNLTIQIVIKDDEFVPKIVSGDIIDLRDKTTLLIALSELQKNILDSKNINDLNQRLKND